MKKMVRRLMNDGHTYRVDRESGVVRYYRDNVEISEAEFRAGWKDLTGTPVVLDLPEDPPA